MEKDFKKNYSITSTPTCARNKNGLTIMAVDLMNNQILDEKRNTFE